MPVRLAAVTLVSAVPSPANAVADTVPVTWSLVAGVRVPMPTFVPLSKTSELPRVVAAVNFGRKFVVPVPPIPPPPPGRFVSPVPSPTKAVAVTVPVERTSPSTCSFAVGEPVPMPTLPVLATTSDFAWTGKKFS